MNNGTASKMSGKQFREFAGAALRSLPDDLSTEVAQELIENQESLRRTLREAFLSNILYPLTVDYKISIERMVQLGGYEEVDKRITSQNFRIGRPIKPKSKFNRVIKLVHFNWCPSIKRVLDEFDKKGYQPAELRDLLAFGAKYPNVQRRLTIIAFDSFGSLLADEKNNLVSAPHLDVVDSRRALHLIPVDTNYWVKYFEHQDWVFAAIL